MLIVIIFTPSPIFPEAIIITTAVVAITPLIKSDVSPVALTLTSGIMRGWRVHGEDRARSVWSVIAGPKSEAQTIDRFKLKLQCKQSKAFGG